MFFLFLSSYLCLSYLHDLLFTVSLPLQTALLNSDLHFWGLCVWAAAPCELSTAKEKNFKIPLFSFSPPLPRQQGDPFHSTSFWLGIQVTGCSAARIINPFWISGKNVKNVNSFLTTGDVFNITYHPLGQDLGWKVRSLLIAHPHGNYIKKISVPLMKSIVQMSW